MLHGRDLEQARLAQILEAAHTGRASSLLIRGGAGMGKSALLGDTATPASGFRVLQTAGLESESALAFAALHRLLRPALDSLAALPAPQRRALRVAFGEEEGDRLDPFLVALGYSVTAQRGETLRCKGWKQESLLRMLENNMEVAEKPEQLVIYGGIGKCARNWESYHAIVDSLLHLKNMRR